MTYRFGRPVSCSRKDLKWLTGVVKDIQHIPSQESELDAPDPIVLYNTSVDGGA